jgi:hypothetical protein
MSDGCISFAAGNAILLMEFHRFTTRSASKKERQKPTVQLLLEKVVLLKTSLKVVVLNWASDES